MHLHMKFWLSLCLLIVPIMNPCVIANQAVSSTSSNLEAPAFSDPVKPSLINEDSSIQPGHPLFVAIELKIEKEWYLYWKNPGEAGMPPSVTWNLPKGFTVDSLIWPTPKQLGSEIKTKFGYTESLTLLAKITPPKSYGEKEAKITAKVQWVVCSNTSCLPGNKEIALTLPVRNEIPEQTAKHQELFSRARSKIPQKYDAVTAKRYQDQIEIAFYDASLQNRQIDKIEFFPEQQKAIDLTTPLDLQTSSEPNLYILTIKEQSTQVELKGLIVLHTSKGIEAYEIDTPIASDPHNETISMANSIGAKSIYSSKPQDLIQGNSSFEFEGGVLLAIVFAFIGGMILNLMPCVLPVISFKVLGFAKMAGQSRRLIFRHGLAFSIGVLFSFWALAGVLLALQAYGRSVGWGFQLQEPLFVASLAALLFIFSLSLFGVFELGTSLMSAAGQMQQKTKSRNELLSSFFSGILATAVATPCTGPFLGSAVGFAVTLPSWQAMLIFTSLGLGMSFPYLLLAAFPQFIRLMPKPGPWMETFKQLMGFMMMASVLWLIWVFGAQTGSMAVSLLLASFFLFSLACWVYGRWGTPIYRKIIRRISALVAILLLAAGSYTLFTSTSPLIEAMDGHIALNTNSSQTDIADEWEEFSPERVAELRQQGIPVFIDFTAKWCLICQTNHLALSTDEVSNKFKERGIVRMKADWTKRDEVIAAELRKFGRNSVPLYVLYDGDSESSPQILPQVLTPTIILESLETP